MESNQAEGKKEDRKEQGIQTTDAQTINPDTPSLAIGSCR